MEEICRAANAKHYRMIKTVAPDPISFAPRKEIRFTRIKLRNQRLQSTKMRSLSGPIA